MIFKIDSDYNDNIYIYIYIYICFPNHILINQNVIILSFVFYVLFLYDVNKLLNRAIL